MSEPRAPSTSTAGSAAGASVPALDPQRVRRERQIGFTLRLAQCASHIHLAAGGRV